MSASTHPDFELLAALGEGMSSRVYLARQRSLKRKVVLKILRSSSADDRRRILREANLLVGIRHPSVVTLYDVLESPEDVTLVLQYEPGLSLEAILAVDRLEVDETIDLALQLASGLDAVHAQGIVHRDIKPSNIWITDSCQPRLLDFGISRAHHLEDLTAPGEWVGTPAFSSPEHLLGESTDARSDLYSLAIVLIVALTGENPFAGDTLEQVRALHLNHLLEFIPGMPSGAPPKLSNLLLQMLQKDPGRRPSSAGEVIARLAPLALEEAARRDEGGSTGKRAVRSRIAPASHGITVTGRTIPPVGGGPADAPTPGKSRNPARAIILAGGVMFTIFATIVWQLRDVPPARPPHPPVPVFQAGATPVTPVTSPGSDSDGIAQLEAHLTAGKTTLGVLESHLEKFSSTRDGLGLVLRHIRSDRVSVLVDGLRAMEGTLDRLEDSGLDAHWFEVQEQLEQLLYHVREPFRQPILGQAEGIGRSVQRLAPRTYEAARKQLAARLSSLREHLPKVRFVKAPRGTPEVATAISPVMRAEMEYTRRLLAYPLDRFRGGESLAVVALGADQHSSLHQKQVRELVAALIEGSRAILAHDVLSRFPRASIRASFFWMMEIQREGYTADDLLGACRMLPLLACVEGHARALDWSDPITRRSIARGICLTGTLGTEVSAESARRVDPSLPDGIKMLKIRRGLAERLRPSLDILRRELTASSDGGCLEQIEALLGVRSFHAAF